MKYIQLPNRNQIKNKIEKKNRMKNKNENGSSETTKEKRKANFKILPNHIAYSRNSKCLKFINV